MVGHEAGRGGRLTILGRFALALALCASALVGGLPVSGPTTPLAHAAAGAVGTGHIWITGHDDDKHCWQSTAPACVYMKAAIDFVRDGSSLPILALDSGPDISTTVTQVYSRTVPVPTLDVVDPSGPGFASLPLVDGSGNPLYSAIVVASDSTCPSCDNPVTDTTAIVARKADIAQFFNEGGGIVAMAGANNYSTYYNFLPIVATGAAVTSPFHVTPLGQSLGLYDTGSTTTSPINCCGTHNSFDLPGPGSPLRVAETDSNNLAETEVVTGQIIDQAPNTGNFVSSSKSDLWMTSAHTDPVTAGTGVSYTLQITNGTGMTTGPLVVTDTVSGPLTLDGASGGADWSCSTSGQTAMCSYQGAGIPYNGQPLPIVIQAHTAPNASGSGGNSATVTAANDVNHTNDTATDPTTITRAADLAVTNTASNPVIAGQDVTYTAVVTNTGPSDAGAYTFQEQAPANTTFQRAIGPTCGTPDANGLVSCNASGLTAGATQTYQFVVAISPTVTNGAPITATARLTNLTTTDPNLNNNSATATATVATSADLYVTSVNAVPNPATAGQDVTYATTFGNNGPSVATNAVLTMTVPTGVSFVSANGGGILSCNAPVQGRVVCTAANVPVASNDVAHLTVAIPSSATTSLTSRSTLTSGTSDPDPTNNSALGSAGVQTAADLSVGMTFSPHPVVAGQDITYTTTLHNAGPSDAATPVVTTTVPVSTTFVSLAANGWNCTTPPVGSGGVVSCTPSGGGSLAASDSATFALTVLADQGVFTGTVLTATSTVGSPTTDPIATNNTAAANANATTSADLGVTSSLTPNGTVVAGQTLTDMVTVTNHGPSAAAAPVVTTTVRAGTTFQGLTSPGDWACTTPPLDGVGAVSCTPNDGRLAAGASAQFVLTLGVPANVLDGSSIVANATTGSRGGQTNDPNQTNNASTATVTVSIAADLAVSDAASSPVVAGQDGAYTTTLVNNGPSDAPNVVVTATVPAGTTFGSFSANGWTCGGPNAGGVVTCTAATLPAGHAVSFPLVVRVSPDVTNGVTLTSATGASTTTTDPNLSNNAASAGARVTTRADLQVTNVVVPTPILPGQTITYRAAFTNAGPSDARGVIFTETLPAGTTFVAVTAPDSWTCAPRTMNGTTTVSCTVSTLAVGVTGTIALSVRIDPNATGGTVLTAGSTIASSTGDPDASNNSSTALVTVLQAPPTATNTTTAAPPNTATSTPVPTGTATNTATTAPPNTATSTPVPAATSSPTTPADTATAIAPSSSPLPAAPDFRPINGAQLSVESAVPMFTANQGGTLSITDARGFTPRSPVRVSIAAAGTTRALAAFTTMSTATGVVYGSTPFTPRTAGVYLVTATDLATGRRVQKAVIALLSIPASPVPATQYFAEGFTGAASDERVGRHADLAGTTKVAIYMTQFALVNRSTAPAVARVTYLIETAGNGVRVARARPDVVTVAHTVAAHAILLVDAASDIAATRVATGPDAGRLLPGWNQRVAVLVDTPHVAGRARVVAERIIERRASTTGAWLAGSVSLAVRSQAAFRFTVSPDKRMSQTYLQALNPSPSKRMSVTLTDAGVTLGRYTLEPWQRITVNLTDLRHIRAARGPVTLNVHAQGGMVIAEEAVYTGAGYGSLRAGAIALSSTTR